MAWAAVAIGGGSVVNGIISNDSANKARDQQNAMTQAQLDFAKEQYQNYLDNVQPLELEASKLGISTQQLALERGQADNQFYKDYYMPYQQQQTEAAGRELQRQEQRSIQTDQYNQKAGDLYNGLIDTVNGLTPDYNRVARDAAMSINNSYDQQKGIDERNLMRLGLRPDSGAYAGLDRRRTMQQAADRANAVNTAQEAEKQRVDNLKFSEQQQVAQGLMAAAGRSTAAPSSYVASPNMPSGPGYSSPTLTGAGTAAGVENAYGNAAANYGNQANTYANDAANSIYSAGYLYKQFRPGGSSAPGVSFSPMNTTAPSMYSTGTASDSGYGFKDGGLVRGQPGIDKVTATIDDRIPARLTSGEYVIPKDVVAVKGTAFFDRLINQYHEGPTPSKQGLQRG